MVGDVQKGTDLLADLLVDTNNATFIYNQGRCFEQNGKNDMAILRFREYLRKATGPSQAETDVVLKKIDELRSEANLPRTPPLPATPSPAPPPATSPAAAIVPSTAAVAEPRPLVVAQTSPTPLLHESLPVYKRWWFWTGIGAVVAGGVHGTGGVISAGGIAGSGGMPIGPLLRCPRMVASTSPSLAAAASLPMEPGNPLLRRTGGALQYWWSVASSESGSRLIAASDTGIYISLDTGATWSAVGPSGMFLCVASSNDGAKLFAAPKNSSSHGTIYASTDSGATWAPVSTSQRWTAMASSADGTKLVAVSDDIYTSSGPAP